MVDARGLARMGRRAEPAAAERTTFYRHLIRWDETRAGYVALAAAVAGLVTAMPLCFPVGIAITAAARLLDGETAQPRPGSRANYDVEVMRGDS
jgi:hypothetical protein